MSRRELVDAQPSTSRAAGDRKQTADLTAAQVSQNKELVDKFRGKLVSHCNHALLFSISPGSDYIPQGYRHSRRTLPRSSDNFM